jgi:hypothetical protein
MIDPFWFYLVCFVAACAGAPLAEWCDKRGTRNLGTIALCVMLLGASVILIKGAIMAMDWTDPFAGRQAEIAQAVHTAKGFAVVAVLRVWPFFLITVSIFFGAGATILLWRRISISN